MFVLPPSRMLSTNRSASSRLLVLYRSQLRLERLDPIVVNDDVEKVFVAKIVENRLERLAGLLDLLAGHRPGTVEHEDHRLGHRPGISRLDLGAGQDQEVAILRLAGPVAQNRRRERAVGERVNKSEVIAGHDIAALEAARRPRGRPTVDRRRRRWGSRPT